MDEELENLSEDEFQQFIHDLLVASIKKGMNEYESK